MPTHEVDNESLHKAIHEELEKDHNSSLLKRIALTTAFFAALAAVASLLAMLALVTLLAKTYVEWKASELPKHGDSP